MRKIAIAIAAVIGMTSVAHADWNGHRQYPRHHYHGGGGGNNNWVAPLVGGLVIGGLLMSSQQNYYAGPGYGNVPVYQPMCQRVFVGSFWNGWRWVNQYQTICD